MSESNDKRSLNQLDWIKSEDFSDKFAEVMAVNVGDRSVVLEFGMVDHDGKVDNEYKDVHIKLHSRIRVSQEHFETMVMVLSNLLDETKFTEGE